MNKLKSDNDIVCTIKDEYDTLIPAIELINECQNSCLEYLKNKYNMTEYQYDEISDMIFNCLSDAQEDVPTPYFVDVLHGMSHFITNSDFATIYKTAVDFNNDECVWMKIINFLPKQ